MLLHLDGSRHQWFQDERWYDLIEILDDATSETYYAQLVEEESTRTVMAALREVIERKGRFCALYSDRAATFFTRRQAGGPVEPQRLSQVGRALQELGVQMIAAYSPQARGRSERRFGTWQGRLPQELRLAQITAVEEANRFLREHYIGEINRQLQRAGRPARATRLCRVRARIWISSFRCSTSAPWPRTIPSACGSESGRSNERTGEGRWPAATSWCTSTWMARVTIAHGPHVVGRYSGRG